MIEYTRTVRLRPGALLIWFWLADLVAEAFNLFNRANVVRINPIFGTAPVPQPGFLQPIAGAGARQIQFSLDFEF
jgi:hypothetical protein